MNKNGNGKTKIDIAILKERVDSIHTRLDAIELNHLPHIKDEITALKVSIARWTGGAAAIGVIIQIILRFIK